MITSDNGALKSCAVVQVCVVPVLLSVSVLYRYHHHTDLTVLYRYGYLCLCCTGIIIIQT